MKLVLGLWCLVLVQAQNSTIPGSYCELYSHIKSFNTIIGVSELTLYGVYSRYSGINSKLLIIPYIAKL